MSTYNRAIELAVSYRIASIDHADVELESSQARNVTLTLLHERLVGDTREYDLAGHTWLKLALISGESLTMIARCRGHIIGALVNEVTCCEGSRLILAPKGGYNLIVYQNRLDPDDDQRPATHHARTYEASLIESKPATQALGTLLTAVLGYYAGGANNTVLPEPIALMYDVLDDALTDGEESNSRELLQHFCAVLVGLDVQAQPGILRPYVDAQNVLRTPAKTAQTP